MHPKHIILIALGFVIYEIAGAIIHFYVRQWLSDKPARRSKRSA